MLSPEGTIEKVKSIVKNMSTKVSIILKHDNFRLHRVRSYHLSSFGFGKVNSLPVQLKCAKPHGVLALACILKGMGVRIASAKVFSNFQRLTPRD